MTCIAAASSGLFHYKEATEFASRDIFYRAWGVEYPRQNSPRSAVVLFTDQSLGATGSWPAPYETHAALLRRLMNLQPEAVMIDIGFIDERDDPTLKQFVDALQAYNKTGIRVYLAAAAKASGAIRPVRKELAALADAGVVKLVSIELGKSQGRMNAYPLAANDNGHIPAARAMYEDYCRQHRQSTCVDISSETDFEVWWAARPHALNCSQLLPEEGSCDDISSGWRTRLARLTYNWFLGSNAGMAVRELDPIPAAYTPTTYWGRVVTGELTDEFHQHFKGSTVFYGLDLALIRDEVFSPVHGQGDRRELPGVYYHAMAFDNLVALGNSRISRNPPLGLSETQHMAALILICCAACLIFRFFWIAMGWQSWASWLDWLIFSFVAISIAIVEFQWLHVTPANWLGVIFSQAPMKLVDASGKTEDLFQFPAKARAFYNNSLAVLARIWAFFFRISR